jgi:hypothetical protein
LSSRVYHPHFVTDCTSRHMRIFETKLGAKAAHCSVSNCRRKLLSAWFTSCCCLRVVYCTCDSSCFWETLFLQVLSNRLRCKYRRKSFYPYLFMSESISPHNKNYKGQNKRVQSHFETIKKNLYVQKK